MILLRRVSYGIRRQSFGTGLRRRKQHTEAGKNESLNNKTSDSISSPATSGSHSIRSAEESASKTIPGPAYFWLDSLSKPLQAFGRAQAKRPYLTQFLSTLTIYLLGDLSAQNLVPENPDEPYSPMRTVRALIIGGLAAIPGYKWFLWLGSSFNYSSKILSIVVKVAVNQVVFTPIFNSYFFGMQRALTGGGPAEIIERIVNTVPTSWLNSLKLWPAVTAFSFTFVPLHYRSIFAGVIAIGWQTYLSFLNQRAARKEREIQSQTLQVHTTA